jgi:hypothetical protein
MDKKYTYQIGGRKFFQQALTPGQWKQLLPLLFELKIPPQIDALSIISMLGDNIHRVLAVVLREKGGKLKDKDLGDLTEFLAEEADAMTTLEVVEDFFGCNPMTSISEKLGLLRGAIKNLMPRAAPPGSTKSSSSFPGETSADGTKSPGNIPSKNAAPGSTTGKET